MLKGSYFRHEYQAKKVDHVDDIHFHIESDKSQPIIFEDNGVGTFTQCGYGLFGPVSYKETLHTAVDPKTVKAEAMFAKSMQSQMTMFVAMGSKIGSGA